MKVIGITGGVGSGKSQILEYLNSKYGATICMADEVAKKLQKKGTKCFDEIVAHFGEGIIAENGELNRSKLAEIVFSDNDELQVLNDIVHPAVKEEVTKEIFEAEKNNTELFILESALLIEDDYEKFCDEIWYVHVDVDARKNRLIYARGYSEEKVEAIMAAQLEKKEYMRNCDRVIDNTGVFDEATIQIDNIMKDL